MIRRRFASLRKHPTCRDATRHYFPPAKRRLRGDCRNSILMTNHYPDLGSVSDWSCCMENLLQPIRRTTQIWVVTRISALVSQMQTSLRGETSCGVAKCPLFTHTGVCGWVLSVPPPPPCFSYTPFK